MGDSTGTNKERETSTAYRLSKSALTVLNVSEDLRDGSDLIFPSVTKPGNAMTPIS